MPDTLFRNPIRVGEVFEGWTQIQTVMGWMGPGVRFDEVDDVGRTHKFMMTWDGYCVLDNGAHAPFIYHPEEESVITITHVPSGVEGVEETQNLHEIIDRVRKQIAVLDPELGYESEQREGAYMALSMLDQELEYIMYKRKQAADG